MAAFFPAGPFLNLKGGRVSFSKKPLVGAWLRKRKSVSSMADHAAKRPGGVRRADFFDPKMAGKATLRLSCKRGHDRHWLFAKASPGLHGILDKDKSERGPTKDNA